MNIDVDEIVSEERTHFVLFPSINREQNRREADEFISTLDPHGSKLITFDAYVEDNFGQADIKDILKSNKVDPISRETRRVFKRLDEITKDYRSFSPHIQDISSR